MARWKLLEWIKGGADSVESKPIEPEDILDDGTILYRPPRNEVYLYQLYLAHSRSSM